METDQKQTDPADLKKENSPSSESIELLLVDDEEGFVEVLSKRLGKRNIKVTTALSGDGAIQQCKKQSFDIMLLDLKMEFMDGIEVLKALKEIGINMPVIMITGHGSLEDTQKGLDSGAVACLPKPYDFEELVKYIRDIYQKSKL
ncbi:MAG: response regulator, partial [Desulfamplus sp.]|nr:response regulator [Desulfamplus sp.]